MRVLAGAHLEGMNSHGVHHVVVGVESGHVAVRLLYMDTSRLVLGTPP